MEKSGRSYFFLAASLILLAASIHGYDNWLAGNAAPTEIVTQAQADAECDANAIILNRLRFGCQKDQRDEFVRDLTRREPSRNGPKMIQMQND